MNAFGKTVRKFLFLAICYEAASSFASSNEGSIHASYIYWLAGEDGLGIGRSGNFLEGDDPFFNSSTAYLTQPFNFQSGFKVGASWGRNNWSLNGDYTWVRNHSSSRAAAPLINSDLGTGVWLIAPWFFQIGGDGGSLSGTQVNSVWKLGMDIADLTLSCCYPLSCSFVIYPYGGLRAAWIRQDMDIELTEPIGLFPSLPSQPISSSTASNSWSVGPRFGNRIHLLFSRGFRIEGNLALSLLFTEYTKVSHREEAPAIDTFPGPLYAEIRNQCALRSVLESGLGLGWNSCICSSRFELDLSATYDFSLWWDQNMMREFVNSIWNQSPVNGNLYLHGLTVSGCFSF